jgi:hypothetical protein
VGIGTTTPANKLSVVGLGGYTIDAKVNGRIQTGDATNGGGVWLNNTTTQLVGQYDATRMGLWNNGWHVLVDNTGKVGVGTATPTHKLNVVGDQFSLGKFKRSAAGSDLTALIDVENGSGVLWRYGVGGTGNGLGINNGQFYIERAGIGSALTIATNGNVGIGTNNPLAKLSVNGLICAKEVRVSLAGAPCWPDYVFSKEYKLQDLNEVEAFIKENHHLPQIPSAGEVDKNGVELGNLNIKMLEKIEELTLYVINMKKENATLQQRLAVLEKK